MAEDNPVELATLGRPFQLGMLYDQRSDQIIPGTTLWDIEELKKNVDVRLQPFTNYELVAEDSINDKTHALGVQAELKLSLLAGLISVSGSGKYAEDRKSSNSQARLTLKYSTTTRFEQLTMNHLAKGNAKHSYLLANGATTATHVVTSVLYGAEAFFIFDRTLSSEENHQDVQGKLEIMLKKIPKFEISGNGELNLNENDKVFIDKLTCTLYGDFNFDYNPSTFEEAVKLYQQLPMYLGKNGENAVPKKVWLYPLKAIDPTGTLRIVYQISINLIDSFTSTIEYLHKFTMKANDLSKNSVCNDFLHIKQQLMDFVARLSEFKRDLHKRMINLLPKIRGGGEEELALVNLLKEIDSSPYNKQKLQFWLDSKENELKILSTFALALKKESISVASTSLDDVISDINYDYVCCLCFHFTEANVSELTDMYNYIHDRSKFVPSTINLPWYEDKNIIQMIRTELRLFIEFAKINKTKENVKFVTNEQYASNYKNIKGATMMLFENGIQQLDFQIPSKPGKPYSINITSDSISLEWTKPERGFNSINKYKVLYCIDGNNQEDNKWNEITTDALIEKKTISNLAVKTLYIFKIQSITIVGDSLISDVSDPIRTTSPPIKTAAMHLLQNATVIKVGDDATPTIYKLEYNKKIINRNFRLRKCSVGEAVLYNGRYPSEKIIMMVGATGAGKTTMINAIVNYYYGTQWNDNFRLKLITEEDEGINGITQSQAKSQTKWITAYTLHHLPDCTVSYTLTIIDTPGFGDTEGTKRDAQITEQIHEFFQITGPHGIDHIDAIGFVIQSSANRLTHTQKYIFDSILSMFGNDIKENVFLIITFADGQTPPVLEAAREANLPYRTYSKFNNSALFAKNKLTHEEENENFDQMFWKLGITSLKNFFIEFQKVQPTSLTLTKEVLTERQHLEAIVQGIQPQIQFGLNKLEELRQEIQVIKAHGNDILQNKKFQYKIKMTKQRKIDLPSNTYVTNCIKCNYTCHYPCGIPNDKEKYNCDAMVNKGLNASCSICPGKCIWNSHFNNTYRFELYQEDETRTSEEMKKRYEKARNDGKTALNLAELLKKDFEKTQMTVYGMIGNARKAIERLEQIALKPNPLSIVNYIELMIESEKQEAKAGWQERIHHLNDAKQKALLMQQMKDPNYDVFMDSNYILNEFANSAGIIQESVTKEPWYKRLFHST
ncbi:unnamed protein product [Rotaria sordida]|uniref:Fibronectin type-III domain-containing protein n=1 Tax=Rotaria sordida TaxID=392033 RepID=A0A819DJV7_9BILA|nr:unnamed protein product [Rotaria sordida]CAF3838870.1 unnamed protein product [Rotaria sordida]